MAVTALVCFQTQVASRNREVTFLGGKEELIAEIKTIFVEEDNSLILQIFDQTWQNGMFVDLISQPILDRSVIQVIQCPHERHVS